MSAQPTTAREEPRTPDEGRAEERHRLRKLMFQRIALAGKESNACFVIAALWGASDVAKLIDPELAREVRKAMYQAIDVRNRLRERLRAMPRVTDAPPAGSGRSSA